MIFSKKKTLWAKKTLQRWNIIFPIKIKLYLKTKTFPKTNEKSTKMGIKKCQKWGPKNVKNGASVSKRIFSPGSGTTRPPLKTWSNMPVFGISIAYPVKRVKGRLQLIPGAPRRNPEYNVRFLFALTFLFFKVMCSYFQGFFVSAWNVHFWGLLCSGQLRGWVSIAI